MPFFLSLSVFLLASPLLAEEPGSLTFSPSARKQVIDGFGTCLSKELGQQDWFQRLYYDDLRCSMLRVDLVPRFVSPYSDFTYNSPWFHGKPSLPGPDGNNVRTYSDAADYTREFAGRRARIAVMGPDIDQNLKLLDFDERALKATGTMAQLGQSKSAELGGFKLIGSLWSPAPWLKLASGNTYSKGKHPFPKEGAAFPFIWFDNFGGGLLDVSDKPLEIFNDGTGPTSSLTQFARCLAAYLRGYQNAFGVKFYAVSIQNEPFLELFYNSCLYREGTAYAKALKAARAELVRYPDLKDIKFFGPEQCIGNESTFLWYFQPKGEKLRRDMLLKMLADIEADPAAAKALDIYAIHGYASDGISTTGLGLSKVWPWVRHGWTTAPNPSVPAPVKGFQDYGKRCWMTETSGEGTAWQDPSNGFPSKGAFGIVLKIMQALDQGEQNAWLYWQLADGDTVNEGTLTGKTEGANSAKYVAAKHFFRDIRPGAVMLETRVAAPLDACVALHEKDRTLTLVVANSSSDNQSLRIALPPEMKSIRQFQQHTSSNGALWKESTLAVDNGAAQITLPGYSVTTLASGY